MKISVIAPLYNEENSVKELYERLLSILKNLRSQFESEIIFVDDGSTDRTLEEIKKCPHVVAVRFKRNYGQTAALAAGIDESSGDIVVTIDADLENQPEDIPLLLNKLGEGFDIVSGWRRDRWENQGLRRRLPSTIANWLISLVTKIKLHDHGCTLKAYKADILKNLNLCGDMHRMIAAYAAMDGARVAEIPVKHIPRKYGRSKYGIMRTFRVLLDLVVVRFFLKYKNGAMYFFGGIGFWSFLFGFLVFVLMLYLKFFGGIDFIQTPLPALAVFFVLAGFQFILMGLLAEIIIRAHYESQKRKIYSVAKKEDR